jgi:hypothetical protein
MAGQLEPVIEALKAATAGVVDKTLLPPAE